jgi:hypothetical protein
MDGGALVKGLGALPREDRVQARRIVLDTAIARLQGEAGGARAVFEQALRGLPRRARAGRHLDHGEHGRRCFLCTGWSAGWSGFDCEGGALCGGCIARATPALYGDVLKLVAPYATTHGDDRPPNSETERVLRAFLALAHTPDNLRLVDRSASKLHHYRLGREALERIEPFERTPLDLFTLAHHYGVLGENEAALAIHRGLEPNIPGGDHGRALYLLNEACYLLDGVLETETGGLATEADLPRLEANLEEAHATMSRSEHHRKASVLAMILFCRATICIRQKRIDDAARELAAARAHVAHSAHRWELEGIIRDLQGDREGAREAWRQGLVCAHPDDLVVANLERRLLRTR